MNAAYIRHRGSAPSRLTVLLGGLLLTACLAPFAPAQDAPKKDDALDKLLQEIDESKADKPAAESKPEAKAPEPAQDKPKTKADETPKPDPEKAKVAPKDEALDSLLEKLGQAEDAPDTKEKPKSKSPDEPMPPDENTPKPDDQPQPGQDKKPGEPKPDDLKGESKQLDEHLEELTGRKSKRDKQKQKGGGQGQGEDQGPMGEVTKRMREVEQRLGQRDTGEQTRQRQTEIVKNLEQLIEQARATESKSQGKPSKQMAQGKPKPGGKEGDQPGANARGVGLQKPSKPESRHANANGKDEWGHLSPMMRAEMENTFKEDPLPSREELIKRYYTAVAKKALAREE
ncbi:hypothetical protein EP7_003478 [Isosphaeraceae bacterium EP7]